MTILLVGGDLRQVSLANQFAATHQVLCYGLEQAVNLSGRVTRLPSLDKTALQQVTVVILPMPMMGDMDFLNAPLATKSIALEDVLQAIPRHAVLFGGKIPDAIAGKWCEKGLRFVDLLAREELAVLNAVPTAEGTLQILLEELPTTIYGLSVLLVGGGRISRVLRRNLLDLGATVTVACRRASERAWAEVDGCQTVTTSKLATSPLDYQCIINTVPAVILDQTVLTRVPKDTLLIDLASKPGGIDFLLAGQLGLHTIWALSLPGKTAPYRAGAIIYQTICNQLEEWGEQDVN